MSGTENFGMKGAGNGAEEFKWKIEDVKESLANTENDKEVITWFLKILKSRFETKETQDAIKDVIGWAKEYLQYMATNKEFDNLNQEERQVVVILHVLIDGATNENGETDTQKVIENMESLSANRDTLVQTIPAEIYEGYKNKDEKEDLPNPDTSATTKIEEGSQELKDFLATPIAKNDMEYLNIFGLDTKAPLNRKNRKDSEWQPMTYKDLNIQNLAKWSQDSAVLTKNLSNIYPNVNESNVNVLKGYLEKYLTAFPNRVDNVSTTMGGAPVLRNWTLSLSWMSQLVDLTEKRDNYMSQDLTKLANNQDINQINIDALTNQWDLSKTATVDWVIVNLQEQVDKIWGFKDVVADYGDQEKLQKYDAIFQNLSPNSPLGKLFLKAEQKFGNQEPKNDRESFLSFFWQKYIEYKLYKENSKHLESDSLNRDNGAKMKLAKSAETGKERDGGAFKNTAAFNRIKVNSDFKQHLEDGHLQNSPEKALKEYNAKVVTIMKELGQYTQDIQVRTQELWAEQVAEFQKELMQKAMKKVAIEYVIAFAQNPNFLTYETDYAPVTTVLPSQFMGVDVDHGNWVKAWKESDQKKTPETLRKCAEASVTMTNWDSFVRGVKQADSAVNKVWYQVGQNLEDSVTDIEKSFESGDRAKATAWILALAGSIALGFVCPPTLLVSAVVLPLAYRGIKGASYAGLGAIDDLITTGETSRESAWKRFGKGVGILDKQGDLQLGTFAIELVTEMAFWAIFHGVINAKNFIKTPNVGSDNLSRVVAEGTGDIAANNLSRVAADSTIDVVANKLGKLDIIKRQLVNISKKLHKIEHHNRLSFKYKENILHHKLAHKTSWIFVEESHSTHGIIHEASTAMAEIGQQKDPALLFANLGVVAGSSMLIDKQMALLHPQTNLAAIQERRTAQNEYNTAIQWMDGFSLAVSPAGELIVKDRSWNVVSELPPEILAHQLKIMEAATKLSDKMSNQEPVKSQLMLAQKYEAWSWQELGKVLEIRKAQAESMGGGVLAEIDQDLKNYKELNNQA